MAGPLAGTRVLDLGRIIAAPFCGMLLADMGAEVIRVERSDGAEDRYFGYHSPSGDNYNFINVNRNKKAISLNFEKNEKARKLLLELVKHADVLVENFSPEAAKGFGITYENMKQAKADIIFAQISGYGTTGPYARRLGFDPIAKAMSGSMSVSGMPGMPHRDTISYLDFSTGIMAALGIVGALYHRKCTGEGQLIDAALLRTGVTYMSPNISMWEIGRIRHPQIGNRTFSIGPSDTFKTKDGRWVYISVMTNALWRRFCRYIDREDMATDPRLQSDSDRWEHRDIADVLVRDWVASQTQEEVIATALKIPIACAPCLDVTEVAHDPQVQALKMMTTVPFPEGKGEALVTNTPFTMSRTELTIERSFPGVGQHNEEIYCSVLGYSHEDLARLKEEGVI